MKSLRHRRTENNHQETYPFLAQLLKRKAVDMPQHQTESGTSCGSACGTGGVARRERGGGGALGLKLAFSLWGRGG